MFSMIRKRITFANVAMTLALVFAMGGGAYAAKKFIITSKSQIKPSVWVQLKGKNGTNGAPGTNGKDGVGSPGQQGVQGVQGLQGPKGDKGDTGAAGPAGATGSPWTVGGMLPSKETEKGTWSISQSSGARNGILFTSISFPIQVENPPDGSHVFYVGEEEATHKTEPTLMSEACPGSVGAPLAEPGYLCVYEGVVKGVEMEGTAGTPEFNERAKAHIDTPDFGGFLGVTGTVETGGVLRLNQVGSEASIGLGTWAVTAK